MSDYPVRTLVDSTFQSKMPLFDGLSKPESVPGFLSKEYGGAYLAYDPRGKDAAGFTPPWRPTKTSPLDDRSPVSHLAGIEARNHLMYRQDSSSLEDAHAQPSSVSHAPMKKGFMLYTKSPEISAPTVGTVRKQKSEHSPSQKHLYLAIPKPVYGHNPCCSDLGCMMGQRYVEHVPPKMPSYVHEPDWMQTSAHYAEKTHIQRKEVLQQRSIQFDSSSEPKRIPVEAYSPSRARTFPSVSETTYSSYPRTPTRTLFAPVNEHGQPLQTIPGGYPSLYAPHPAYEHMTSDIYQEHSPIPKYGQLAQRPVFYYAQANGELENRTLCKDSGNKQRDAPLPQTHSIPSPLPHYLVPSSLHAEIPFSCTEMLPNPSFMRGFDYPYFAVPRFHLNSSQMRSPLEMSSPTLLSSCMNISPPRDKSATSLHVDSSLPFVRVDQTSPASRGSQPAISLSSRQAGRFFHPLVGLHHDTPALSPAGASTDRLSESPSCQAQVTTQPQNHSASPAGWMLQSATSDQARTAAPSGQNGRKVICSPKGRNQMVAESLVCKQGLKRSISHSSPPVKIKEEDRDLYEVECSHKQQKVEKETDNETDSPPMPVIDNVFSLAPYQLHLQASGVLFPGRVQKKDIQTSQNHEDQPKRDGKEKMRDGEDSVFIPKDLPSETREDFKTQRIKVEKGHQLDTDTSVEICDDYSKQTIKKEHVGVSENEPVDEKAGSEIKSSTSGGSESLAELKPAEPSALVDPSSDPNVGKHFVALLPKSSQSPQIAESKVDFKNIPPHVLKLSTYNIIIPGSKHRSTEPETLSPQLVTVLSPKPDLETPVRKHFLELHHSLCKLISKSVSASLEEDLKTWLFQMGVTEPACRADKVKKVSSLLGVKARELWINEEIKSTLGTVLDRLREYTSQERCPFPHVMRTGAVFLPMLVMKELLFPMVHGSFIDQVLQEHKVELRPTTLSEEKILIQLHKRACSSKLRRLMSLKHLPDVYTDVVNLLYYTYVCKYLGLTLDQREENEIFKASVRRIPVFSDVTASPISPPEPQKFGDQGPNSPVNRSRTQTRVKSRSRIAFLDSELSDEGEGGTRAVDGGILDAFAKRKSGSDPAVEEHSSTLLSPSSACEDSWMCPLTPDDRYSSSDEAKLETPPCPPAASKHQIEAKKCSGMILKLRKMLSAGGSEKRPRYQAVSASGTIINSQQEREDARSDRKLSRTRKALHRWRKIGGFTRTLRPLSSRSLKNQRSLLKIKYCPYLSTCHSAEHRRRWVLRSAVQRARGAMRTHYPDLVGKKIHHLYEEDDKSEVWYRGEVLRVHEAHTNPMKTIFEVQYDSEPEWKYYLELLMDYQKGWLKIED